MRLPTYMHWAATIIFLLAAQQTHAQKLLPDTLNQHADLATETQFNPAKHLPGRLLLLLPAITTAAQVQNKLQKKGYTATITPVSKTGQEWVLVCNNTQTQLVRNYLAANGITVLFDEFVTAFGEGRILPNDTELNNYDSDDYQAENYPNESTDTDSVLAFTPPQFKDSKDHANEKVKIVFNEPPHAYYYNIDFPGIDTLNSYNNISANKDFSSYTDAHASGVMSGAVSYTNDSRNMSGLSNVNKSILQNIKTTVGSTPVYLNSAYWAELDNILILAQTNPDRGFIITKSHGGFGNSASLVARHNSISTLSNILMINAAGNSNSRNTDWEQSSNFPYFLSIGATEGIGVKASFSNWGSYVDAYFQGEAVWGLQDNGVLDQIDGTSFSAPRVAAILNVIWNLVGGPARVTAVQLCNAVKNCNRTMITQPDGSQRPLVHMWDILMRFVNTMDEAHAYPFYQNTEPTVDLKQYTRTAWFYWMKNVKYYINDGMGNYTLLPNGILNTTAFGTGLKEFKIEWDNDGVPGTNGQETTSTLYRFKEIAVSGYTFTGSGSWTDAANWVGNTIPPVTLTGGSQIIINPSGSNECVLSGQQNINPGASLKVAAGKKFRVVGNLRLL